MRYLKRLAFLLLCSGKDTFHPQLAFILEKLTETLKLSASNQAPALTEQVFLCIRVLLLRLSASALTPVWPILLTELIKVFSSASVPAVSAGAPSSPLASASPSSPPSGGTSQPTQAAAATAAGGASVSLSLLLAALKVVDVAALLDLPEFHLYQWMFVEEALIVHAAGSPKKDRTAAERAESRSTQFAPVSSSEGSNRHTEAAAERVQDGTSEKEGTNVEDEGKEVEREREEREEREEEDSAPNGDRGGEREEAGGNAAGAEKKERGFREEGDGERPSLAVASEEKQGVSAVPKPEKNATGMDCPELSPTPTEDDGEQSMMFIPFGALLAQWSDGESGLSAKRPSSLSSRRTRQTPAAESGDASTPQVPRGAPESPREPRRQETAETGPEEQGRGGDRLWGSHARRATARRSPSLSRERENAGEQATAGTERRENEREQEKQRAHRMHTGGPLVNLRRVETPQQLAQAAGAVNAASVAGALLRTKFDEGLVERSIENDLLEVPDGMLDLWADIGCPKLLAHLWDLYTCGFDIFVPSQSPPHAGPGGGA
ncbi:Dopey, N-terminal domain-containing protein [Toxoplasma gondii MAS]|uniref:Dopey, N-terminal domain-containing protein n=1 Tax=Toxoplasma gondii MAS TaxID=943118 RepID=A0A086QUT6_TOXGO|nr:Dopey, N-terminal domain-containing protein [Toxoplasma gondii MAS]